MSVLETPAPPAGAEARTLAGVSLDARGRRATVRGEELYLSEREFTLLDALVAEPGRHYAYEELIADSFAGRRGTTPRVLELSAERLSRKLELRGVRGAIVLHPGVGVQFSARCEGG